MVLFTSDNVAEWRQDLDMYAPRLKALGKEKLVTLDSFYREELAARVAARAPRPYLTGDELVAVVDWKLTRGKWRPRLLAFAKELEDGVVRETTERAFAMLADKGELPEEAASPSGGEVEDTAAGSAGRRGGGRGGGTGQRGAGAGGGRGGSGRGRGAKGGKGAAVGGSGSGGGLKGALEALTELKGIGPATASALLALVAPETAPFMSDEAMQHALGGVKEYTAKRYLEFAAALQQKAQELRTKNGDVTFTASDVERALWSTSAATMPPQNQKLKGAASTSTKQVASSTAGSGSTLKEGDKQVQPTASAAKKVKAAPVDESTRPAESSGRQKRVRE